MLKELKSTLVKDNYSCDSGPLIQITTSCLNLIDAIVSVVFICDKMSESNECKLLFIFKLHIVV